MNIITTITNLILGKKAETPEEHLVRLEALVRLEEAQTAVLAKKIEGAQKIKELQSKILDERKAQVSLYATLGADTPQVQKSKRIRMYVGLAIALVIVLIIAKSCIKI